MFTMNRNIECNRVGVWGVGGGIWSMEAAAGTRDGIRPWSNLALAGLRGSGSSNRRNWIWVEENCKYKIHIHGKSKCVSIVDESTLLK